ncbi:hypothetical protein ABQE57_17000 [Mycolicibacterium elephantis]
MSMIPDHEWAAMGYDPRFMGQIRRAQHTDNLVADELRSCDNSDKYRLYWSYRLEDHLRGVNADLHQRRTSVRRKNSRGRWVEKEPASTWVLREGATIPDGVIVPGRVHDEELILSDLDVVSPRLDSCGIGVVALPAGVSVGPLQRGPRYDVIEPGQAAAWVGFVIESDHECVIRRCIDPKPRAADGGVIFAARELTLWAVPICTDCARWLADVQIPEFGTTGI